jgi:hypothetical protein
MYQNLKDDLALQMYLYARGLTSEINWGRLEKLGMHLGQDPPKRTSSEEARKSVRQILDQYGFAATKYILQKSKEFTEKTNKRLLIVLFDPSRAMRTLIESGERYDREIVEFLENNRFKYFDMNVVHAEDYKDFALPVEDYLKRYFIGHYSPAGNHFFAFSIKDSIVDWLEPKPITYRESLDQAPDFAGYLLP